MNFDELRTSVCMQEYYYIHCIWIKIYHRPFTKLSVLLSENDIQVAWTADIFHFNLSCCGDILD